MRIIMMKREFFHKFVARRGPVFLGHLLRWGARAGATLLVAWIGTYLLFNSDWFKMKHLKLSETHSIGTQEIRAIFEPGFQHNLLLLDIEPYMEKVSRHPWVREVQIRKVLPDTLLVHLVERTPAVLIEHNKRLYWVDETGVVLGPAPARLNSFPRINGISLEGLRRQEPNQIERFRTGLALIESVLEVSEEVGEEGSIMADLTRGSSDPLLYVQGYALRLGLGGYGEKWKKFLAIRQDLQARGVTPEEIDLRFDDQVIVRAS